MREWLTTELLLGTLVATTFTCVGILALWVATSPRYWFLRAAVAFAILCPLLLVPAQGLFITFFLHIALVTIGVAAYRLWRRWRDRKFDGAQKAEGLKKPRWQFSVKSALAACTCVAVVSAILVNTPQNSWDLWPVIVTTATIAAIITVVAAWVVNGKSKFVMRVAGATCFAAATVGIGAVNSKGFEVRWRMLGDALSDYFSIYANQAQLLVITGIAILAAIILTQWLARAAFATSLRGRTSIRLPLARLAFATWLLLILVPPALTLVALLQPLPVVDTTLPDPNGYDELAAIGNSFDNSAIAKELSQDVVNIRRLDAAVTRYDSDFVALRKALDLPFRIPVQYNLDWDLGIGEMPALRQLARALNAKGDASLRAGNVDESLACWSDILRLAQSMNNSGLLIHFLVRCAVEYYATEGAYHTLSTMNAAQCRMAIRNLSDYERNREDFEDVRRRELVWMVRTYGWPNHLGYLLDKFTKAGNIYSSESAYLQVQAVMRLLEVALALRAYQLDHGHAPQSPADLVPEYLATFPTDPFDGSGRQLLFAFVSDRLKVWSRGHDRDDDGGKPLPRDADGYIEQHGDGDLWLADFFADAESQSASGNENEEDDLAPAADNE